MSFWRRPFSKRATADNDEGSEGQAEISDGDLKYVVEKGGNDSLPSYQEASGAPVERESPLGYAVGPVTIIFLNISKMIGTGVYSTRELDIVRALWAGVDTNSLYNSGGHWFRRFEYDLLGPWISNFNCFPFRLSRVRGLLSQPIWIRGRISGAGISAA